MEGFKLPFPPTITAQDIIASLNKRIKRPPNAFIIYRKVFVCEVEKSRRFRRLTRVSPLCGNLWRQEPKEVKDYYRRLAEEVDMIFLNSKSDLQLQTSYFPPPQPMFQLFPLPQPIPLSQSFSPSFPSSQPFSLALASSPLLPLPASQLSFQNYDYEEQGLLDAYYGNPHLYYYIH